MLRNNIELDLKTRFAEEGITQTEVAEKLGVSPPYVNRIIRGEGWRVSSLCQSHHSGPRTDRE